MNHPMPGEYTIHLEGDQGKDLILILDASESAVPQRDRIIRLCVDTLAKLPADVRIRLYFLGNPQGYSAHDLDSQAPVWFEDNSLRASLISPVLQNLSPQQDATLVVVGDGLIYDLDDWRDSPFWPRLRLVSFSVSLQPAGARRPELTALTAQALRQSLYDPVTAIELRGPGFLPLAWDCSAYRRVEDRGTFALCSEHPPVVTLTVRCLLCRDANLQVERHHATGRVSRCEVPLLPAAPRPVDGRLTPEEVAILDRACRRLDFTCPYCGQTHAWDTLRCRAGRAIIAQPVFPSLPNQGGFVQLCRNAEGADYRLVGEALPLGNGLVALREDTHARLVRFDFASARWLTETGEFFPYQPLGLNGYGLLL